MLNSVQQLAPGQLPELLGELETIRATALLKMSAPVPALEDRLLGVKEAAERLGVSAAYLYDHARKTSFYAPYWAQTAVL